MSIGHSYTAHIKHSVVLRLQKTYAFHTCQSEGESEKHRSWNMPVECFRNRVATDVPLDHDEEMVPMHGMYGTLDADLEVQRTNKWQS